MPEKYYATGKRKCAIARVYMMPGSGKITINDRAVENYFGQPTSIMILRQPLELTETSSKFDFDISVCGGGPSGQAGAIKHGISKVLLIFNPDFRPLLKKAGFLTRDPRAKERKKYGRRSARARFQFSKR